MTDLDRFLSLLDELRRALGVLRRYRDSFPRERLLADVDTQNMVLFALYRAVQGCIDLGQHVIAERGLAVPSAYREVFRVLGEAKLLDAEQTDPLERWAGMRNVIAHQYGALDLEVVADALYDHLEELDAFAVTMARLLSAEPQ